MHSSAADADTDNHSPPPTPPSAQLEEDFMKAARKIQEGKKLESKLDYTKVL
jgi:hypothetical protein